MKRTNRLKKYEQYEPWSDYKVEGTVDIDSERLVKLVGIVEPLLSEISGIIRQEDDRTISIEYYNKITSALSVLEDLKNMYK